MRRLIRRFLDLLPTRRGLILVAGIFMLSLIAVGIATERTYLVIAGLLVVGVILMVTIIEIHLYTMRLARIVQSGFRKSDKKSAALLEELLAIQQQQQADSEHRRTDQEQLIARFELAARDFDRLTRSQNSLVAHLDRLTTDHKRLSAQHEQLVGQINRLASEHGQLEEQHEQRTAEHSDLEGHLAKLMESLRLSQAHQITEIDALLQLNRRLNPMGRLPLLDSWAMSPRGVLLLIDLIEEHRPKMIVECGPGTSTAYMALAIRNAGYVARIVGLEHLEHLAAKTHELMNEQGVPDLVEIRFAPLERWDHQEPPPVWYSPTGVSDLNGIDLLVIDGPPGSSGEHPREPAFPLLKTRLREGALIVVDDARRAEERAMITKWLESGELTEIPVPTRDQRAFRYQPAEKANG